MTHRLFLRWALGNSLAVLFFTALALAGFADGLHGAPAVATGVILAGASLCSGYCGWLFWLADAGANLELPIHRQNCAGCKEETARILHRSEHVFQAVAVCQILGLIGAMLGYREISSSAGLADANAALHAITLGLGNGLTATLCGVICSLILWLEHHALTHSLERA